MEIDQRLYQKKLSCKRLIEDEIFQLIEITFFHNKIDNGIPSQFNFIISSTKSGKIYTVNSKSISIVNPLEPLKNNSILGCSIVYENIPGIIISHYNYEFYLIQEMNGNLVVKHQSEINLTSNNNINLN